MRHESRAMAMPTPGNFPDSWEDKNEKDENDEIEKGQESESWTKEAWNVFKNKLDEYSSGRVGTGIKMYAGDTVDFVKTSTKETVDFVKSKVEALSKSDRLTFFNGLAREGTFIVAAKNDLMEKVSENFSYNFKNKELREHFQGSAKVFKDEKEKNYSAIDKLEKGEARDLERIKGVGTGAGTLIKYVKLTAGTTTPLGIALMGTMTAGHHSEVAKKARLQAESVIEKTRVGQLDENGELIDKDDLDRAWEEANKIYNEALAKSKDGEVSAKDLDKAYQENLPKDILERIGRNENYEGLSLLQKGMIWNMEKCAKDVEAEFMKIESSDKTEEEKEAEKQVIIERNKKLLEELDGMVSDQGIVDSYAYLARAGEKTGKAATLLVTLGITTEGIHKAWDSLKEVNYSRFSETVANLRNRFMNWTGTELNAADGKSAADYKSIMENIKVRNPGKLITDYSKEDLEAFIEARNGLKALDPKSPEVLVDAKNQNFGPDINVSKNSTNDKFNESINKYDSRFANAKTGTGVSSVKTAESHFQIAENVKVGKNDSIWKMGEKYLRGNQKFLDLKGDKGVEKALETYNIDRIKDEIVAHPENYGLPKNVNFEKLSAKQLSEIKWQEAFDKVFVPPTGKEITETLTDQQVKGVLASNRAEYEKRFGHEHHGGGKGRVKVPGGIDAPPRATAELVPDDLEAFESVPVNVASIDDTKIIIDGNLVIDKDSQFADEYKTWSKASVDDFLHGRFGEPIVAPEHYSADGKLAHERPIIHKQADALEISNRNLLRERLQNAQSLIGDPKKGETVADYLAKSRTKDDEYSKMINNHLKEEVMSSGSSSTKNELYQNIQKMPGELKKSFHDNPAKNRGIALGYVKMFFSDRSGIKDGIKSFFNYQGEVNPEDIKIKPDGSILYENAFGKKGYDLQISREKIGVDGPGWNNLPKNRMTLGNIKSAKDFIYLGKTMEDNINDYEKMEKGSKTEKPLVDNRVLDSSSNLGKKQETEVVNSGGTGHDSKSDRGRKNDLNMGQKSEENNPGLAHVEGKMGKNVDNGMEKSAGKGGVDDVNMKKLQELEKKAESLEKNSSTIKPEKKVFYH